VYIGCASLRETSRSLSLAHEQSPMPSGSATKKKRRALKLPAFCVIMLVVSMKPNG
jgi:hypothetical protein